MTEEFDETLIDQLVMLASTLVTNYQRYQLMNYMINSQKWKAKMETH